MENWSMVSMSLIRAASATDAPDPQAFNRMRESVLSEGGTEQDAAKALSQALTDGLVLGNWPTT
jgi:hypothetical protein